MAKEKIKEKGILEKKDSPKDTPTVQKDNLTKTLILALVGLVLLLIPETLNKIIGIVVGAALLLVGLAAIYRYVQNEEGNSLNLISGILYSVLGVIIMVYPYSVLRLVSICLGVYLLVTGLIKLKLAISLKDTTDKWIGTLIVAIIILVLGLLLIFNPFSGIAITKLAGAFLVAVALFDVIDTYIIQK